MTLLTPLQIRSAASKKAWRSRKRMQQARQQALEEKRIPRATVSDPLEVLIALADPAVPVEYRLIIPKPRAA